MRLFSTVSSVLSATEATINAAASATVTTAYALDEVAQMALVEANHSRTELEKEYNVNAEDILKAKMSRKLW